MIIRENGVRRARRISFDRSYIAHTRRIIATAISDHLFLKLEVSYTITHDRLHQEREEMYIYS